MRLIDIRTPPQPINWRKRVAESLAALPPSTFTPQDDLRLVERALLGVSIGGWLDQQRVLALLRPACNDQWTVTIDGQRALVDALRARAAA